MLSSWLVGLFAQTHVSWWKMVGGAESSLGPVCEVKTLVGYKDWMDSIAELVGCDANC